MPKNLKDHKGNLPACRVKSLNIGSDYESMGIPIARTKEHMERTSKDPREKIFAFTNYQKEEFFVCQGTANNCKKTVADYYDTHTDSLRSFTQYYSDQHFDYECI